MPHALQLHRIELKKAETYRPRPYVLALAVPLGRAHEPAFHVKPWDEIEPPTNLGALSAPGMVLLALLDSDAGAERAAQRLGDLREVLAATRLGQVARDRGSIASLGLAESLGTEVMGLACQLQIKGGDQVVALAVHRLEAPKAGELEIQGTRAVFHVTLEEAEEEELDPLAKILAGNVGEVEHAVLEMDDPAVLQDLLFAERDAERPRKGVVSAIEARLGELAEEPEEPEPEAPETE